VSTEAMKHPNYFMVWVWLVVLAVVSVAVSQIHMSAGLSAFIIFGAAFAKAIIVALYFMHLKHETLFILALVATPLLLFVILIVTLLPDFVFALAGA
jgi:cytochrome c oxidase subunit 4